MCLAPVPYAKTFRFRIDHDGGVHEIPFIGRPHFGVLTQHWLGVFFAGMGQTTMLSGWFVASRHRNGINLPGSRVRVVIDTAPLEGAVSSAQTLLSTGS